MREDIARARLGRITASRFHIATFGSSAAKRALVKSISEEREDGEPRLHGGSDSTEWGNEWEDAALDAVGYRLRHGFNWSGRYFKTPGVFHHPDYPMISCTPDAVLFNCEGTVGIEVKCPYKPSNHLDYKTYGWPVARYECQVQGSMWVTGFDRWVFASYDPREKGGDLWCHIVYRDERMIARIATRVLELQQHIDNGTLPYD